MFTVNKTVRNAIAFTIKACALVAGLIMVAFCVKMATDFRSKYRSSDDVAVSARDIEKQLQCMAKNIYWEAASEPFEGKVAVAQVTLNRVASGKFPATVCGVVYQKTKTVEKVVCQFSWLCENNHLVKPLAEKQHRESEEVAKMVMLEGFRLPRLNEAMYYHADYVNPRWNKEKITQIGHHVFYKD